MGSHPTHGVPDDGLTGLGLRRRSPARSADFWTIPAAGWAESWSAGRLQARVRAGLGGPLDRHPDQVPPLHPRAVVVAHPREPKQVSQDKPSMAGPLADTAVGDNVILPPKA